jgi:hypothetical protein
LASLDAARKHLEEVIRSGPYEIRFPARRELEQDREWCEVLVDGAWKRIRFHDYHEIYKIPGLYETIFYRTLYCVSPTEVTGHLRTMLLERGQDARDLSLLDLGAGNGMSGEALQSLGIRRMMAVDIIPEARAATLRDRPWVYNDYFVADLTKDTPEFDAAARAAKTNTLVTIAALGFGDIPPRAFFHAFNLIQPPGWVAFNIKESFLEESDRGGFAGLIGRMRREDILRVDMFKRYRHRLSIAGEPLYYVAMIARKLKDIPAELLAEIESAVL